MPMLWIAVADQHCNNAGLISKQRSGHSGRLDTTGLVLSGPGALEFWSPCAWSFHRLSGCRMCASTSGSYVCRKIISLRQQHILLQRATGQITWTSAFNRHLAVSNGLRILLARGYDSLHQIPDDDLKLLSSCWSKGTDALDAALCSLGVFSRTPKRGSTRHSRRQRLNASELVETARIPEHFRQVTILYLETYEARVSGVYRTLRHKSIALAHFWNFVADEYPDVNQCSATLPRHVRDYIPYAVARARADLQ